MMRGTRGSDPTPDQGATGPVAGDCSGAWHPRHRLAHRSVWWYGQRLGQEELTAAGGQRPTCGNPLVRTPRHRPRGRENQVAGRTMKVRYTPEAEQERFPELTPGNAYRV